MKQEVYCLLCSRATPLVFDVAASREESGVFIVYAYCDCGRVYEHEFIDSASNSNHLPMRFIAKPLSHTKVKVVDLLNGGICVHEFDINDDDVYCEHHDEALGYDLQSIKQEIVERTAALVAMATT